MSARRRRWLAGALILMVAAVLAVAFLFESGIVERRLRDRLVAEIEQRTGARVDLGGFHLHAWGLSLEIDNLTLHGLEAPNQPPLFHADRIDVAIGIVSFFGRQIALDKLTVERPEATVVVDGRGRSNVPTPRIQASRRPWRETLFQMRVRELAVRNGTLRYNDEGTPLAIDGNNFEFVLRYDAPAGGADSYIGSLQWKQVRLAAKRDLPFRFDFSAKFALHHDSFEANEIVFKALHSNLNLQAELPSFSRSDWNLKYRGLLSLADVRSIFRQPTTPDGNAYFSGLARYVSGTGAWTASGHYSSVDVRLPYRFFHEKGIETSGDYEVANRKLVVPNLSVHALGGTVVGQLEMGFKGLAFRTKTQFRGASLSQLFDALDNSELPVRSLHWDGVVGVDSVNTWNANFKNFRTTGEMLWSPPRVLRAGAIPATARVEFDYRSDRQVFAATHSEIGTPTAHVDFDGLLSATDSAMEVKFRTDDLLVWDDFIGAIRGPDAEAHRVAGKTAWSGRILGPLKQSAFVGHFSVAGAQYDNLALDQLDADMEYSPDAFILKSAVVRRGDSSSTIDLSLKFDGDWNFLPSSPWTLSARVEHATSSDLQSILGTNFPVTGNFRGDVRGRGTRAAPVLDVGFVADDIETVDWHFDRFSGQLHTQRDELRLSDAELHEGAGIVSGEFLYRPDEQQTEFDVTGSGIALERIRRLQTGSLPIGGQLEFKLSGSGPLRAPTARADLHVTNLKFGTEAEGDFSGQLTSDGQSARVTLASEPQPDKLHGEVTIGLTGDQRISGKLSFAQFDLDPLIVSGLHLKEVTGHSSADGSFTFSGSLSQPDTIEVDADISRISFNYALVQLTNDQPIRLTYSRNEVRVEQAHLHGPNTDLQLGGSARFDRDRRVDFTLSGSVNLHLLTGMLPDLDAQGRADVNMTVEGTIDQPRVTGRASVRDASATYAEFPAGLSKLNGDIVFDRSRLFFDRITAESGGGQLTLRGSMTYGEGPLRYEVSATTSTVRIRYPAGMSWLAGGTLQLSGTSSAALLSGNVRVERLLFAQGVDVASFFASASETAPGPASSSPFLQNLAFDVEGQTNPGARIEWAGAHVEIDGNVRLRGTWDRPVLLGHIHLLGGAMPFRGNNFELTRGDINFANPFRLDPVLNVEATSTISQYQVTIDFSGPASHLALNYRSDPPLPDADIVALLALGSPGEGSGLRSAPGAAQNYGATALLSEAISSGIGGRIEHLFGISSFRVDPFVAGTATESNAAARVTIEQQVARDLTITYSTNAATSNQYQLIQVEYAVKRGLSVVFLRDINGTYGLDVKFVKHFN
ncbi:MAG TPA: translocation/assembly module TamB domain-containing protein [Candidatus Acidoferrales bacterium]|nr:translocation/assembly module TamB domain-containing protein [Candidatus Acidoferrales bacterium]